MIATLRIEPRLDGSPPHGHVMRVFPGPCRRKPDIADSARFAHAERGLCGGALDYPQIAATPSTHLPYTVSVVHTSAADMLPPPGYPGVVIDDHLRINDVNFIAKPEDRRATGPATSAPIPQMTIETLRPPRITR